MKNLIVILLFILVSLQVKGNNELQSEVSQNLIISIGYDYELICDESGGYNCDGELKLEVTIPKNCNRIIFEYTKPFITNVDRILIFTTRLQYLDIEPENIKEIIVPNIKWGTYFRVRAILDDETIIYSPNYYTNTFINEDDLKLILDNSSIDNAILHLIDISVERDYLDVYTESLVDLLVVDINGNILFAGQISTNSKIPINKSTSPVIIVKYRVNNISITKKLKIS